MLYFTNCQPQPGQAVKSVAPTEQPIHALIPIRPDTTIPYATMLHRISAQRRALSKAWRAKQIDQDSVQRALTDILVRDIFPYWYGTKWSFEGHTDIPQQETIACGYFVSTILLQAGLPINRYKIAQQNPQTEANMLAFGHPVRQLNFANRDSTALQCGKALAEGLYFVGLEGSHVGFLLKKQGQLISIHANYIPPDNKVVAQHFDASPYPAFETFYITPITGNQSLMEAWLAND